MCCDHLGKWPRLIDGGVFACLLVEKVTAEEKKRTNVKPILLIKQPKIIKEVLKLNRECTQPWGKRVHSLDRIGRFCYFVSSQTKLDPRFPSPCTVTSGVRWRRSLGEIREELRSRNLPYPCRMGGVMCW